MSHYNDLYEQQESIEAARRQEECKKDKENDQYRTFSLSLSEDLLKINKEFQERLKQFHPTFAEEQTLFALKNYIDSRFELLAKKLLKE